MSVDKLILLTYRKIKSIVNLLMQKIINIFLHKIKKVKHNDQEMSFFIPNWVNKFRVNSFHTKEPDTLKWIDSMPKGAIFWDVGANIGLYSIYAAKINKCKVLAFEPSVFNLEWLARNIDANSLQEEVSIMPIALSNHAGFNLFKMKNTDWGGALSTFGENYDENGLDFRPVFQYSAPGLSMNVIPNIMNVKKPDYVKIDVDGIEHLILEGAGDILKSVKSVLIEIDDEFFDQASLCNAHLLESGLHLKEKYHITRSQYNQLWVR